MWVSCPLGQEEFNLDQALHFARFSHRAWSAPRALQAVDLRIIWLGKGSRFCESDYWILVPEEDQVPSCTLRWRPDSDWTDCMKTCMP